MGWLRFFGGLFKNVHMYIYIALFSVLGTLWFLNGSHVRTIKKQATEIVEIQQSKIRLERSIAMQNKQVNALRAEGEKLRARVAGEVIIISAMDENGERVLLEIDKQSIPESHQGALMWMIQKSMEELKQ